jgi:hypothetical protein
MELGTFDGDAMRYEAASYTQSYEKSELDHLDMLRPLVTLDSIFSIQSLAMGILRHRSRTKMANAKEKKYGFAMYHDAAMHADVAYDGSIEEYMTCRVKKVAHDQWKMRVRFRQNELTQAANKESYIDDYLFDWTRGGEHMAGVSNRKVTVWEGHTFEEIRDLEPLDEAQMLVLQQRMIDLAEVVNPEKENSLYSLGAVNDRLRKLTGGGEGDV